MSKTRSFVQIIIHQSQHNNQPNGIRSENNLILFSCPNLGSQSIAAELDDLAVVAGRTDQENVVREMVGLRPLSKRQADARTAVIEDDLDHAREHEVVEEEQEDGPSSEEVQMDGWMNGLALALTLALTLALALALAW